jgi:hypothetical protein
MAGRLTIGLIGLATASSLAACGGGSTTVRTGSGTITVHPGGKATYQFSSSGSQGAITESVGSNGVSLPTGFPSGLPLPQNGKLVMATKENAPAGSLTGTGQASSTGTSYDLIYKYPTASAGNSGLSSYDHTLSSDGYSEQFSSAGSSTVLQSWTSGAWKISITLGPTGNSPASELALTFTPAAGSQG